jgi:hypothetical protein
MSKKKAADFQLRHIGYGKPYYTFDFLDKKGRVMRSSVDVLINSYYFINEAEDWDYEKLAGFVRSR